MSLAVQIHATIPLSTQAGWRAMHITNKACCHNRVYGQLRAWSCFESFHTELCMPPITNALHLPIIYSQ